MGDSGERDNASYLWGTLKWIQKTVLFNRLDEGLLELNVECTSFQVPLGVTLWKAGELRARMWRRGVIRRYYSVRGIAGGGNDRRTMFKIVKLPGVSATV